MSKKFRVKVTSITEYSASDTRYLHLTHLSPHIVIRRVSSHFSPEASCAKESRGRFARRVDGFTSQYIGRHMPRLDSHATWLTCEAWTRLAALGLVVVLPPASAWAVS